MLTREQFCKYIDKMRRAWETDFEVNNIAQKVGSDFLGSDLSYLICDMCELLEVAMGFSAEDEDIVYFCIDKDFGKSFKKGDVEIKLSDRETYEPELKTAEDLYDFLVLLKSLESVE